MSNAQASLTNAFKSLLENEDFVDVTLSAGGKTLRAHKVVLSACSSYFKQLLRGESTSISYNVMYTIFDNFSRPPNKCDKCKKVFIMCLSVLNFICVDMSCTFVLVCVVGITSLFFSALVEDRFFVFAWLILFSSMLWSPVLLGHI